jgi:hypothetical protein
MRGKQQWLERGIARQPGNHIATIGSTQIVRGLPADSLQLSQQELRQRAFAP